MIPNQVGEDVNEIIDNERIIKSKVRVQKHGEVFTPKWLIKNMLDRPGVKEACEDISATFLEIIFHRLIQFNDCTTDLTLAG